MREFSKKDFKTIIIDQSVGKLQRNYDVVTIDSIRVSQETKERNGMSSLTVKYTSF